MQREAGPGRPRDPAIASRVLEAALDLYVERGWSGFSLAAVVRRAAVGRAAVYLRWTSKEDLLIDALGVYRLHLEECDTGSVRADLCAVASQILAQSLGRYGTAFQRLQVEASACPELLVRFEREVVSKTIAAGRAIIRRAIARGELPEDTSVTLVLNALVGGVNNRVSTTATSLRPKLRDQADEFVGNLVDLVLVGARNRVWAEREQRPVPSGERAQA